MERYAQRLLGNTNLYVYLNIVVVFAEHSHLSTTVQRLHDWAL